MANKKRPSEFDLIARYFAPLAEGTDEAIGLIDDAGLFTPPENKDLVVTTDALIEGVHFRFEDPPQSVAAKALRVNLSDLAGMGAVPLYYTLAAGWSGSVEEEWIAVFCERLKTDQETYGISLLGGDTVSAPDRTVLSVTAIGTVPRGKRLLRSAAKQGDDIWVSGTIGDAALGLKVLNGALKNLETSQSAELIARYGFPDPRVRLGPTLLDHARAGMDISDGLLGDLKHICDASGVGAIIRADEVPLSDAAQAAVAKDPTLLKDCLTGGDDYELLWTASPAERDAIEALADDLDLPLTVIGEISEKKANAELKVLDANGQEIEGINSEDLGFVHKASD